MMFTIHVILPSELAKVVREAGARYHPYKWKSDENMEKEMLFKI